MLFAIHFLILLPIWAKVGGEFLFNRHKINERPAIWRRLDLPAAYPWAVLKLMQSFMISNKYF
jgi:hypothetical protein